MDRVYSFAAPRLLRKVSNGGRLHPDVPMSASLIVLGTAHLSIGSHTRRCPERFVDRWAVALQMPIPPTSAIKPAGSSR
jgi:hypothetical protein